MLLGILLTIHILVCVALIGVVLLQRSEGGALGMGGGPTGFMTARGAGDLLTRTTWILFAVFLVLSVALTLISGRQRASSSVTDRLKIESLDPNALNRPATPAPTDGAPAPLTAPTPSLRTPAPGADPLPADLRLPSQMPTPDPTNPVPTNPAE